MFSYVDVFSYARCLCLFLCRCTFLNEIMNFSTSSIFNFLIDYLVTTHFLKARYSLCVLKVPLNDPKLLTMVITVSALIVLVSRLEWYMCPVNGTSGGIANCTLVDLASLT